MKKYLLILSIFFITVTAAFAQHEADNWYFGDHAGISFKNDTVKELADGQLFSGEGCATISDKNTGDLLFYTNGDSVWDRNHKIMKNGVGLLGGTSSAQGVVIVPNPSYNKQYYVFTAPDLSNSTLKTTKLHYSIVSLENPDGEVITKNIPLLDSASERVTATLDCEGTGFWVVTHHYNLGVFYAYHVTSSGVNPIPVISRYSDFKFVSKAGCLKISPDRTKIAMSALGAQLMKLGLFDFNPKSGKIYNYIELFDSNNIRDCYGLAFSPDNTKLYANAKKFFSSVMINILAQFDVTLSDSNSIRESFFIVNDQLSYSSGAMQLTKDGKIYCAGYGIKVIDKPNLKGIACDYNQKKLSFALQLNVHLGLPNFMDYIFNQPIPGYYPIEWCKPPPLPPYIIVYTDSGCAGNLLKFTDKSVFNITSRKWIFESGTPATSTDSIVSVTYTKAGKHRVWLKVNNEYGSDSVEMEAIVFPNPVAQAGVDKTICVNESAQLGALSEYGNTYRWQPVEGLDNPTKSNPIATPTVSTQYILAVTNSNGCTSMDTVQVTFSSVNATVSGDTAICLGSSVQLSASGGTSYQWFQNDGLSNSRIENPIATPKSTIQYKVIVSNGFCIDSSFVKITVIPPPVADAGPDLSPCLGEVLQLGVPPQDGCTYNWQPQTGLDDPTKSNPILTALESTDYVLTVINPHGCSSQDITKVTIVPAHEYKFSLRPEVITILPDSSFETALDIPLGVQSWKLKIMYDDLIVKFDSLLRTSIGVTAIPSEQNGQLELSGTGENGNVILRFKTFLPHSSDTIFTLKLTVDSAKIPLCDSTKSVGNTLQLDEYCGRRIRMVSSTGKKFYLKNKENSVSFGVGVSGKVLVELYDYTGAMKEVLVDDFMEAGEYSVNVDLPTGMYFCKIKAGQFTEVQKVLVIK